MKNLLFLCVVVASFLFSQEISAKYFSGSIYYKDGREIAAEIKFPITAQSRKIKVKFLGSKKPERILVEDIKFIEVLYGSNKKALLTVGRPSKFSKRSNGYVPLLKSLDSKGFRHIGIVVGIEGDIVYSRHGAQYSFKKRRGELSLFTIYDNRGYSSYFNKLDNNIMIEFTEITSKRDNIRNRAISFMFGDKSCRSILKNIERKDFDENEEVIEYMSRYAECTGTK